MSRLEWSARSEKDLRRLDRKTRERIIAAMRQYVATGDGDIRRLKGRPGEFALRVGDWRLLFTIGAPASVVRVLRVRPRGQAYRS